MIGSHDDSEVPSPTSVSGYLRSTGWDALDASDAWARFRKEIDGEELVVEVPLKGHAPDYRRRFDELVSDLQRLEDRTADSLIRDIRTSASDLIKIRLCGNYTGGRIPVELGARAFWGARDLLLAAACATVEKRAVYSGRKPRGAPEYLDRARFGPAEAGSFVLTIESAVPPRFSSGSEPSSEPGADPFDRAVGLTLARATTAARRIIDQVSVTGSSTPIAAGIQDGMSSNLCDAIAGLIDVGGAQTVELSFRWASVRPTAPDVPRAVRFEGDAGPYLWEMARTLRERSPSEEIEVVGPIYKVASVDPEVGGEITVAMVEPWRGRKVRIQLVGPAYQAATLAHGAGQWISCEGDLDPQSGVLLNPRHFRILSTTP